MTRIDLGHGDAADRDLVDRLIDGRQIGLLLTSPPYNAGVNYDGGHDDAQPLDRYLGWLRDVLEVWLPHLADGGMVAWNVAATPRSAGYRHATMLEELGLSYWRHLVWEKAGIPLPMYHNTEARPVARRYYPAYVHEHVWLFSRGEPEGPEITLPSKRDVFRDVWTVAVGHTKDLPDEPVEQGGRSKTNRSPDAMRTHGHANKAHGATMPLEVAARLVLLLSAPGELVADPFAGAATTMIAAARLGRDTCGTEILGKYVDLSVDRLGSYRLDATVTRGDDDG